MNETQFADDEVCYVDIRVQQRNGRSRITTVSGLPPKLNFKILLKAFKKEFACNGCIVDADIGKVVQLQGDLRGQIRDFLINEELVDKDHIRIHGF